MKTLLALLALSLVPNFVSSSAFATPAFNSRGIFTAQGIGELMITQVYSTEGTIAIFGAPAKVLWKEMTNVPVSTAFQFQPNDRKEGKGLVCEKSVTDGVRGGKKGDVICYVHISNLSNGAL
jgi:hypothetical protein